MRHHYAVGYHFSYILGEMEHIVKLFPNLQGSDLTLNEQMSLICMHYVAARAELFSSTTAQIQDIAEIFILRVGMKCAAWISSKGKSASTCTVLS